MNVIVRISFNREWKEFRVTMSTNADATYHTDDTADAIGTANAMAKECNGTVVVSSSAKRFVEAYDRQNA